MYSYFQDKPKKQIIKPLYFYSQKKERAVETAREILTRIEQGNGDEGEDHSKSCSCQHTRAVTQRLGYDPEDDPHYNAVSCRYERTFLHSFLLLLLLFLKVTKERRS